MNIKLVIAVLMLGFIISLGAVGAYIDLLTGEKSKYIGYKSLIFLLLVGMYVIVTSILMCFVYILHLIIK